jgi:hypothetical protein
LIVGIDHLIDCIVFDVSDTQLVTADEGFPTGHYGCSAAWGVVMTQSDRGRESDTNVAQHYV